MKEQRVCKKCNISKSFEDDFYKEKNCVGGRGWRCKKCINDYAKFRVQVRCKFPNVRFNTYKHGASRRNLIFNIDFDYFNELLKKECFYCGSNESIGVDRYNNSEGYNFKNCVPCCTLCNRLKQARTAFDFIEHCKKVAKKCNHQTGIVPEVELSN